MKVSFLAILALCFVVLSCKKSNPATEPPQIYMSYSVGSFWIYETQNNLTSTTTSNTVTSSSRDSVINSKTYHVFTNSNGAANDYYNITGNDYYTFKNLTATAGINPIELIYLKDNALVGANWSHTINFPLSGVPTTVPVVFTNTITEKGISKAVNGITYTNVIHITTTIAVTGLPAGSITTDIQSYYAGKYGLIESKNKISIPSLTINIDQNTLLKSATIN
jgi:hypothetical protein